ncbi:MAG: elongator complex protein 3 [Butyricicoccaceae bacterium]
MKRSILPIFIPHLGCPHNCVFCDQKQIAAQQAPTPVQAAAQVEAGLDRARQPQIAFYGGSFTAIGREAMTAYLEAVQPFLRDGRCAGIRLSTRPDAVDDGVLDLLARYGVDTIELGAQSMSDEVLRKAGRGHRAADTSEAARRVKAHGFELILQMMVGLPGSTAEDERQTARQLAALGPDGVRIYPTCVLAHTPLYDLYRQGLYQPLTVDGAVEICADLLDIFEKRSVPVIRLGLNPTEALSGGAVKAGAYHPALGELVFSERFYRRMLPLLPRGVPCTVVVPEKMLSIAIGQKKRNLERFRQAGCMISIRGEKGCLRPEIRPL